MVKDNERFSRFQITATLGVVIDNQIQLYERVTRLSPELLLTQPELCSFRTSRNTRVDVLPMKYPLVQ